MTEPQKTTVESKAPFLERLGYHLMGFSLVLTGLSLLVTGLPLWRLVLATFAIYGGLGWHLMAKREDK